ERIGIYDNFFDLGGHSLKATRLAGQIHKEFGVKVSAKSIFMFPTIEGLSNILKVDMWIENRKSEIKGTRNIIEI
ncbi:acyl carrier protein, partial [Pedobacter psychrotolerans]|uniref:acyl carrier protein n=1 Tax=Pedobacter psychrotolerans TaxID=1843235 RepID=UPI0016645F82